MKVACTVLKRRLVFAKKVNLNKEQCLALSVQLKKEFKISDYKIYRIFPSGEVQYLHPKDGVVPEKVNPGRSGVGNVSHSIGKNLNPIEVKFSSKGVYD